MHIPAFFLKELKWIDPTYFVIFDSSSRTFDIMKDIKELTKRKDGSYELTKTSLLLAFFKQPNDKALTRLRERKQLGIRLNLIEHPKRYEAWIKRINAEARAMKERQGLELILEGYRQLRKHNTSKTVDYGGVYDKSADKNSSPKLN